MDFQNLYLIGEIGINHNGDMQIAKDLMCAVRATGWHCAKFQKRDPETCVPRDQWSKIRSTPWGEMTYIDYKKRIEFSEEQYGELKSFAGHIGIDWSASVWDLKSLDVILGLRPKFLKIPSAMLCEHVLLAESAKSGLPIIASTGMSTLEEVDAAVDVLLKSTTADKVCIMHTNSSYPTPKHELNLSLIPFLRDRYKLPVGYSGHEQDLEPSVAAALLGAKVIERHITLSHDMWGTDQKASLEVHAMSMLKKRIDSIEQIMGTPNKIVTPSEVTVREKLRGY